MRENVLRDLASRAATHPDFLQHVRHELEGTLVRYGYHLTNEEMRFVEGLRQQIAGMSDEQLTRTLAVSLEGRLCGPPARPSARVSAARVPQDQRADGVRNRVR